MTSVEQRAQWAENSAAYRVRHPGRQKVAMDKWRSEHPEDRRAAEQRWATNNPAKMLVKAAKRRALAKGIPFDITWEDISPLPRFCPVLGYELQYGPGRGRKLYENRAAASLDRVENSRGYVKGNVIVVSLRANLLKGQATLEELQKIAAFYTELAGG